MKPGKAVVISLIVSFLTALVFLPFGWYAAIFGGAMFVFITSFRVRYNPNLTSHLSPASQAGMRMGSVLVALATLVILALGGLLLLLSLFPMLGK